MTKKLGLWYILSHGPSFAYNDFKTVVELKQRICNKKYSPNISYCLQSQELSQTYQFKGFEIS